MFKKITMLISALAMFTVLSFPSQVFAVDPKQELCGGVTDATGAPCDPSTGGSNVNKFVQTGLVILQVIAGAIATFYLIFAGIKFITSGGSTEGVKSAKNSIIYTGVGIVIILIAQFIVQFVLKRFE